MREANKNEVLRVLHSLWMKNQIDKQNIISILTLSYDLKLKVLEENCIIAETLDGNSIFTIKT